MKFRNLTLTAAIFAAAISTSCKTDTEDDIKHGDSNITGLYINEIYSSNPDWIELYNSSDKEIDLSLCTLQDDKGSAEEYIFPEGTKIPAGGFLVLEQDASFTFGISSSNGDEISLFDSKGNLIDKMAVPVMEDGKSYGRLTDGGPQTGIMANPTKGAANDSTPGDDSQEPEDPDTPVDPAETTVFINEAMSSPAGDDEDFIELYNASDSEADISGFILQDDKGEEEEFVIPDGTVIPAKGFIAFTKDEAGSFTFGLGAGGDKVTFLDSGRNILDSVELPDFGDTEGSSYARTEDGAGEWAITENPTKGASNNN